MDIFFQQPKIQQRSLLSSLFNRVQNYLGNINDVNEKSWIKGQIVKALKLIFSKKQDNGNRIIDLTIPNQAANMQSGFNDFNCSILRIQKYMRENEKIRQLQQVQKVDNKNKNLSIKDIILKEKKQLLRRRYHKIIEKQQKQNNYKFFDQTTIKLKLNAKKVDLPSLSDECCQIEQQLLNINRFQLNYIYTKVLNKKIKEQQIIEGQTNNYEETQQIKIAKINTIRKINQLDNKSKQIQNKDNHQKTINNKKGDIHRTKKECEQQLNNLITPASSTLQTPQISSSEQLLKGIKQQKQAKQTFTISINDKNQKQNPFLSKQTKKLDLNAIISGRQHIFFEINNSINQNSINNTIPNPQKHESQTFNSIKQPIFNKNVQHNNNFSNSFNQINSIQNSQENFNLRQPQTYQINNEFLQSFQSFNNQSNSNFPVQPGMAFNNYNFVSTEQSKKAVQLFFGESANDNTSSLFQEVNKTSKKPKCSGRKSKGNVRIS